MVKKTLIFGTLFFCAGLISCTSVDCHCTYYNEAGEEVPSYSYDYEEMGVPSCSDLSTITAPGADSIKGFICE